MMWNSWIMLYKAYDVEFGFIQAYDVEGLCYPKLMTWKWYHMH
jgi:hypothetical protein